MCHALIIEAVPLSIWFPFFDVGNVVTKLGRAEVHDYAVKMILRVFLGLGNTSGKIEIDRNVELTVDLDSFPRLVVVIKPCKLDDEIWRNNIKAVVLLRVNLVVPTFWLVLVLVSEEVRCCKFIESSCHVSGILNRECYCVLVIKPFGKILLVYAFDDLLCACSEQVVDDVNADATLELINEHLNELAGILLLSWIHWFTAPAFPLLDEVFCCN